MIDNKTINEKNLILENATKILKEEFVGIDKQIDTIIANIKPWYMFPDLQDRPLVINLIGMTGCGKTSLVRRIASLLGLERDLAYFNFAELGEHTTWEIEHDLEDELGNDNTNKMFIFDEFQYAASLDGSGNEKNQKKGLKPFWELIDNGIFDRKFSLWDTRPLVRTITYMLRIQSVCPMIIENGIWTNTEECFKYFTSDDISGFKSCFSLKNHNGKEEHGTDEEIINYLTETEEVEDFFIKENIVHQVKEVISKQDKTWTEISDVYNKMRSMNAEQILEFLTEAYESSRKGYKLNYKSSIIFVLANLDEAYDVSFNVDPDMSPDQFHKQTEKITVVDIKEALKKRFRNEQIARLGNIFITYPAFSSEDFRDIIKLSLKHYTDDVFKTIGINVDYEPEIYQLIYDEAVFPTHGTRPIFSSVHELVKSKLPKIMMESVDIENVSDFLYKYDRETKSISVDVYSNEKQKLEKTITFGKENLRVVSVRDSEQDEKQAMVALHESGHFVVYMKHHGTFPEKVVSKTASTNAEGFLLKDADEIDKMTTRRDILNEIEVALGGYVAEEIYFGKNDGITTGASQDLKVATALASQMVRNWGMEDKIGVSTYLKDGMSTMGGALINYGDSATEELINKKIEDIIKSAKNRVEIILKDVDWRKMFIKSTKYLAEHSTLPKTKMAEFYEAVPENKKTKKSDTYYRDLIENL